MRESRTYGSVRGACDETHVPTATGACRPLSGNPDIGGDIVRDRVAEGCRLEAGLACPVLSKLFAVDNKAAH
jgi:hypothetical protein